MAQVRTNNIESPWCESYRGPFRFKFDDSFTNKENQPQASVANMAANATNCNNPKPKTNEDAEKATGDEFKFSFPTGDESKKARARAHNLKLPDFDRLLHVASQLSSLQTEINKHKQKLDDLMVAHSSLETVQSALQSEVEEWHRNWRRWSEDDLIAWIFRIDSGYFKLKQSINADLFDKKRFQFQLSLIISRHQQREKQTNMFFSVSHFEGKYLIYFDVLDIKQLFGSALDADDARKLYEEIQRLINSEKPAIGKHELCSVCFAKKKDSAMKCGHILCSECVQKMHVCPFCKKRIDKKSIIKIYL